MGSLGMVFKIIEAVVARQDTGLSFAEIVAATRAPKSTAHRLLKELTQMGYLLHDSETNRYRGSLKLAGLGSEVISNFHLRDHVHPHLLVLRRETDHTCHMGVRQGAVGVYIDKIESRDYGIKLFSEVGKNFPLHCTGLGKAILAHTAADVVAGILSVPLEAMTANTITDPQKLKKELTKVRDQGFALDLEEITRGLICVAAPVFGLRGDLMGSISVTLPSYVHEEKGLEAVIAAVKKHAAAISGVGGKE